jgi:hypothetical protein
MKTRFIPIVALAFACTVAVASDAPPRLSQLSWLAGSWQFTQGGRAVTEIWMAPDGKTMLGVSRTVANGATREYEFMLLREEDDRLTYTAKPSGKTEATFALISSTGNEVIFENPTHEFPQRISYRLNPDGSLLAAIEGTVQGKVRRVEYPYRRVQ